MRDLLEFIDTHANKDTIKDKEEFALKYYNGRGYNKLSRYEKDLVDYAITPAKVEDVNTSQFADDDEPFIKWKLFNSLIASTPEKRAALAEEVYSIMRNRYNDNLRSNIEEYEPIYRTVTKTRHYTDSYGIYREEKYNVEELVNPAPKGYYLGAVDFPPLDWDGTNAGYEKCNPVLYSIDKVKSSDFKPVLSKIVSWCLTVWITIVLLVVIAQNFAPLFPICLVILVLILFFKKLKHK